ncbi:MAG: hypothetical protein KC668_08225 [Myxococcales bacterium]|nr:hypothetical protein [Myxococcales bacterium]
MPYDVLGWIETTWTTSEDRAEMRVGDAEWFPWSGTVCLDGLGLPGDAVSNLLFGLAKEPAERALFAGRGLPPEPSRRVIDDYAEDQRAVEPCFGHTFATLTELRSVRWDSFGVSLEESAWSHVVRLMEELSEVDQFDADRVRIAVWACW